MERVVATASGRPLRQQSSGKNEQDTFMVELRRFLTEEAFRLPQTHVNQKFAEVTKFNMLM
ncbi:MAG: hypothetical protein ACI4TT_03995 [Christensenellales bacterium]